MHVSLKSPELDPEQLFGLVRDLMEDQMFRQLKDAKARQVHIQKKLGLDRRAVNGLGEVTSELDPFLAQLVMEATKDADGTKHAAVLSDPVMHRVLAAEGIQMRVKCGGTTTARVGFSPTVDYAYQAGEDRGERIEDSRKIRFRKTYASLSAILYPLSSILFSALA
jgi:hypothetical protein